jgi:hypothetical protein
VPERAENASDETTLDLKDEKPRVFSRLFHRVLEISKKEV